jgi:hypothetical protein
VVYVLEEGNDAEWGECPYSSTGPSLTRSAATNVRSIIAGTPGTTKLNASSAAKVLCAARAAAIMPAVDVQIFDTGGSHTWTKPAGAKAIEVYISGGGGGGGSGRRGPSGTPQGGGAGGQGGGFIWAKFLPAALGATEPVTVGAGGAGGAAITTDSTDGNNGVNGGDSTFGAGATRLFAAGGSKGFGGKENVGSSSGSAIGFGRLTGTVGGFSTTGSNAQNGGQSSGNPLCTGGGGGAGHGATPDTYNGGNGGLIFPYKNPGAAGGVGATKTPPEPGVGAFEYVVGTGGGGGWCNADGTAGDGAGGSWGAGGGGGASLNGNPSGAGGAGGNGRVVVVTYF